jgi:hypothetical protein
MYTGPPAYRESSATLALLKPNSLLDSAPRIWHFNFRYQRIFSDAWTSEAQSPSRLCTKDIALYEELLCTSFWKKLLWNSRILFLHRINYVQAQPCRYHCVHQISVLPQLIEE